MVMNALRNGAVGGSLKYFLMSLLGLSVAGLVFMDVQGVLTGRAISGTDVAKVADQKISIQDFDRTARLKLSRYNMTPQEAYQKQVMNQLLAAEITALTVFVEADRLGINISEKHIQDKVVDLIKPYQQEGQNLQETLDQLLRSQGIKEKDFTASMEQELTADVITETVQSGFGIAPAAVAKDLFQFQNQTRDLKLIYFPEDSISEFEQPDDERIQKLYDAFKDIRFKVPELRTFEIAVIDDAKLKEQIVLSDEQLQEVYDARIEDFTIGEQRVLDQVVAKTKDDANQIISLMGESDDLQSAASQVSESATYIPESSFRSETLMADMREPVMAAELGAVIGPFETALGFHVLKLHEIKPPSVTPFEEVKEQLLDEEKQNMMLDQVYELSSVLDDILAGGGTFEEADKEVPLSINSLESVSRTGLGRDGEDAFSERSDDDKTDKDILLEEGFYLQSGETSRVIELPSGRFVAIALRKIEEPTHKPLEDVREDIIKQYISDQQRSQNQQIVNNAMKSLESGEKTLDVVAKENGLEVMPIDKLEIRGAIQPPLVDQHRPLIFQADIGSYLSLPVEGGLLVVMIEDFFLPDPDGEGANITEIRSLVGNEIKDEVVAYYVYNLRQRYPSQVNETLLKQVYGASSDDSGN